MTFILMASFFAAAAASTAWAVLWGEPWFAGGYRPRLPWSPSCRCRCIAVMLEPAKGGGSCVHRGDRGRRRGGILMLWWSGRRPSCLTRCRRPRPPGRVRGVHGRPAVRGRRTRRRVPDIMPWTLDPGAVGGHGSDVPGLGRLLRVRRRASPLDERRRQLAGFLAYDVVLIVPLVTRSGRSTRAGASTCGHTSRSSSAVAVRGLVPAPGARTRMFRARPSPATRSGSAGVRPGAQVLARDAVRRQVRSQSREVLDTQVDLAHAPHEADLPVGLRCSRTAPTHRRRS